MNEVMGFLLIGPLIIAMWGLCFGVVYCIFKDYKDR